MESLHELNGAPALMAQLGIEEWVQSSDEAIAHGLEAFPRDDRLHAWQQVPESRRAAVLIAMHDEAQQFFVNSLTEIELSQLLQQIDPIQLLDISEALPDHLLHSALHELDENQRKHYRTADQYHEDQIGHYIDHQIVKLPINASVHAAQRLLNRPLPPWTDAVFLTDRTGRYSASVNLNTVMTALPHQSIAELIAAEAERINASDNVLDAIAKLSQQHRAALPVVDQDGFLLGRITLQDGLRLQREHYEERYLTSGGLSDEEDLFAPLLQSIKTRTLWLGINLITALLASWTIGIFETTISHAVALAVLMPIVASMGGIAGSQTLTLIVRAVALGQVTQTNMTALIQKEVRVGFANGVIWSLLIGGIAMLWFGNYDIGLVIGLAILVNLLVAAIAGLFIPVFLNKIKIDPALSGTVILTTVTDIVGFFVFLGLGTLILIK